MRPLRLTPRESEVLTLLCELGETRLVAHKLKLKPKTIEVYISRMVVDNGHMNRLTLALAWDRQQRAQAQKGTP